ncbi:ParA family protein, partial [Serratia marcescens]|uniref:ParA family protein n=1 Tax=Serratia marcescens TaxID=615 RepID=UPI0024A79C37
MHTLAKSTSMGVSHPAPRVIPMVSTKGGEGKSTQSANLAGFLADAGKKTLLVDGD